MATSDTGARRRGADLEAHTSPRPAASGDGEQGIERAPRDDLSSSSVQSSLTERGHARLSKFLAVKSLAETLLLVALVAAFSYTHFNPRLRGALDEADARTVSGWVVDESDPYGRVEVELYIDGHFVARRRADAPRPDVVAAGRAADQWHGYVFETPTLPARSEPYEARVFAAHAGGDSERIGLQQVGKSLSFSVAADARGAGASERWWEGPVGR